MTDFPAFLASTVPAFEATIGDLPCFYPDELTDAKIEAELRSLPHLVTDLRFEDLPDIERIFRTDTAATAAETLATIPTANQAFHLVINGRFALWDFVAAILKLSGDAVTIRRLHLATLGFSRKNIKELATMLDAGRIQSVALLCSHYFKGTSGGIYEFAQEQLAARSQRFASVRTHAKLVTVQLSDDRTVSLESSANLRSCKNIEQVTVYGCPELYRFHVAWIESLFE